MKILSYILAFYIILLSAVPCCAFDNCPDDKIESSTQQQESNDKDCGNCSPFFNCEGCAMTLINFEPIQFEIPFPPIVSVYTGYIQLSLPKVNYEFWQPPKLG